MTFEELKKIYAGKKVFLTGHTGFKGTWFTLILNQLGATVKGYALPAEGASALYNDVRAELHCESVIGDIRNREKMQREIENFQPDFVFHMAAQALVIESYKTPVDTFQTNVMGTIHVMEALKHLNQPCVGVMITTDKVYENKEREEPYTEDEPFGGYDPYSNSKACCELAISSYRNSFFNPNTYSEHQISLSSVRSGNVIGGGDWSDNRIIPDIVRALSENEVVWLRNPNSVRPWQHVLDPLMGYLTLGALQYQQPQTYAQGFNFGPDPQERVTVQELVEEAIAVWGSGSFAVEKNIQHLHEAGLLRLDIKKANDLLNWKPKYNAKQAIAQTIAWYKAYQEETDIKDFTEQQISTYFNHD